MKRSTTIDSPDSPSHAGTSGSPGVSDSSLAGKPKYEFGFHIMGPILAECCDALQRELARQRRRPDPAEVLFCARGGLVIRRSLELYLEATQPLIECLGQNFMISRLAAARLAYNSKQPSIQHLLALEFEGRSCEQVAAALSQEPVDEGATWSMPYSYQHLRELLNNTERGRALRARIEHQAMHLRQHINTLAAGSSPLCLVDTGVFGSIGHYLSIGLPKRHVHMAMLFRANYKGVDISNKTELSAAICHSDHYNACLLYTSDAADE